jgi:glycerol-1-phosphate dehydrogenase [NAD(P)+]
MENLQFNGEDVSHGFKVGVGTLIATLLFQYIIEHRFEDLIPRMTAPLTPEERQQEVAVLARRGCYGTLPEENTRKKYLSPEETLRKREKIRTVWPELQKRLQTQIIPYPELRKMLQQAGCPTRPAEIGLDREQFLNVIPMAQTIRVRYTVLDLLYELGLLDRAMDEKLNVMC